MSADVSALERMANPEYFALWISFDVAKAWIEDRWGDADVVIGSNPLAHREVLWVASLKNMQAFVTLVKHIHEAKVMKIACRIEEERFRQQFRRGREFGSAVIANCMVTPRNKLFITLSYSQTAVEANLG